MAFLRLQKLMNNGIQTRVIATWESMVAMNLERLVFDRKDREVAFGATDVTGKNNLRMVGHWGRGYYGWGLRL